MVYRCFGAIVGDIIGSRFEFNNHLSKDFRLFDVGSKPTDDSYLTIAVMAALKVYVGGRSLEEYKEDLVTLFKFFVRTYPDGDYGGRFYDWALSDSNKPYGSFGNGAAMRVSPCAYVGRTLQEALDLAKATTEVTHNHPQAFEWVERLTTIIYMLRTKAWNKDTLRAYVKNNFPETCQFTLDEIRDTYYFNETCLGTVPVAVACVLEGEDFEDVIRNAVAIGGDSDTIAAIAGSIAEPLYGIPMSIFRAALPKVPSELRLMVFRFSELVDNI